MKIEALLKKIEAENETFNKLRNFETIKSIEDACKVLGEKDTEVRELKLLSNKGISRRIVALQELIVITKALNEGWEGDWDNSSQYKYILWFYLGKDFRLGSCCNCNSCSFVPARLCHKSREIALYSAKQFIHIWKDAFNS